MHKFVLLISLAIELVSSTTQAECQTSFSRLTRRGILAEWPHPKDIPQDFDPAAAYHVNLKADPLYIALSGAENVDILTLKATFLGASVFEFETRLYDIFQLLRARSDIARPYVVARSVVGNPLEIEWGVPEGTRTNSVFQAKRYTLPEARISQYLWMSGDNDHPGPLYQWEARVIHIREWVLRTKSEHWTYPGPYSIGDLVLRDGH